MTKRTTHCLIVLVCLALALSPAGWAAGSEKGSKKCSNGIDDDGDGDIDCDDSGCFEQSICGGGDGDGGGGGAGAIARGTVRNAGFPGGMVADRFRDDGVATCAADGSHYWHPTDTACGDTGRFKSNLSPGGRLHFFSSNGPEPLYPPDPDHINRWGVFDWTDDVDGSSCPNLDQVLYGGVDPYPPSFPPIDPDPCIDNLEFALGADRMFKANATRQQLRIKLTGPSDPDENGEIVFYPVYTLEFVDPLYLVDTADADVRLLTTTNPDTGLDDVALAELWFNATTPIVFVGEFLVPLEIRVERFAN